MDQKAPVNNPEAVFLSFTLESLSDDLLAQCFAHLDVNDLLSVELACHRIKRAIEQQHLWAAKCTKLFPDLAHLIVDMDTSQLERLPQYQAEHAGITPEEMRVRQLSLACKRLYSSLAATAVPEDLSLIHDALDASSTDHPEEDISRTLDPIVRTSRVICYWSSSGSEDENSDEWLSYRLKHPLCMVHSVQLRPYKAWFQWGAPIYASKKVSVALGGLPLPSDQWQSCIDTAEMNNQKIIEAMDTLEINYPKKEKKSKWQDWIYISPQSQIKKEDSLQTVTLANQTLCVGGYLQLNLHGRTQRQSADDAYYTCIGYVKCMGKPIYHFKLVQNQPDDDAELGFQNSVRLKLELEAQMAEHPEPVEDNSESDGFENIEIDEDDEDIDDDVELL